MKTEGYGFLAALQLSDSFFPVGTFTFSYSLESYVQKEIIKNGKDVKNFIEDYLKHQIGPLDMVAVSNVFEASVNNDLEKIIDMDNNLTALKLIKETREGSLRSGKQFLELMTKIGKSELFDKLKLSIDNEKASGNYATILGIAAQKMGSTKKEACFILAYSFVTGILGVSMRLLRLGHFESQSILEELKKTIVEVYEINKEKNVEEMGSFSPYVDIMGMIHERAEARIFSN